MVGGARRFAEADEAAALLLLEDDFLVAVLLLDEDADAADDSICAFLVCNSESTAAKSLVTWAYCSLATASSCWRNF